MSEDEDVEHRGKWASRLDTMALQFAPLPLPIFRSPKIKETGAKLLYAELMSWAWKNGGTCRPPQDVLAWHLNVTERTIQRWLDSLREAGAIKVIDRRAKNLPNEILFLADLSELCEPERLDNRRKVWKPAMELALGKKAEPVDEDDSGKRLPDPPPDNSVGGLPTQSSGASRQECREPPDNSVGASSSRSSEEDQEKQSANATRWARGDDATAQRNRNGREAPAKPSGEVGGARDSSGDDLGGFVTVPAPGKPLAAAPRSALGKGLTTDEDHFDHTPQIVPGEPLFGADPSALPPTPDLRQKVIKVWDDYWAQVQAKWPDVPKPNETALYAEKGKTWAQIGKVLLRDYDLDATLSIVRCAVWDWDNIKREWRAAYRTGSVPTIQNIVGLRAELAAVLGKGVSGKGQSRNSDYYYRFIVNSKNGKNGKYETDEEVAARIRSQ